MVSTNSATSTGTTDQSEWYRTIAQGLVEQRAGQEICLIVNASKMGFNHPLLVVALAFRKRALLLAWTWVKGNRGRSSNT
jgi:hypothetical protein